MKISSLRLGLLALLLCSSSLSAFAADKPVFLYSRYFNAEGETRYLPDGTYTDVLAKLKTEFTLQIHSKPLTKETLRGVQVVLISNPSEKAVGNNPPPRHVSAEDVKALTEYVREGGGLIVMGNQEDHNLEIDKVNTLLSNFGLRFANLYTDAKGIKIPSSTPVIGGLTWAYYTGNLAQLDKSGKAKPTCLVENDVSQKPLGGPRNQAGCLLATSEFGKGRVVVVTDSGWISNAILAGEGIGAVVIKEHDNYEIFRRLSRWAAGAK